MKHILLTIVATWLTAASLHAAMPAPKADTARVTAHLRAITKTDGYRNYKNTALLARTAAYIHGVFAQYADTAFYQPYRADGRTYRNVVCRFGSRPDRPVMVIGAHYDVCGDQQGADDNASGVVALLELARMLHGATLSRPVELVAYTLEEPPFFRTPYMGSNIHAQSLKASGREVYGMAAIEMIGYFSDDPHSQDYPVKPLKIAYGTRGDYIMLVRRSGHGEFVRNFSARFAGAQTALETSNLKAPGKIRGIDFSDHLNYWNAGYDALMVTNTAFFRNKNYHQPSDTMETLDIPRMSQVIDAIFHALVNIDTPAPAKKKAVTPASPRSS